jgi:3-deoxy-D-manno-octulosonate 8-phosphate phosphatase (KDO 8-P phosphatase)
MNNTQVKVFVIDVDGTLTDGDTIVNEAGVVSKNFHLKDFYAIENLNRDGFKVVFITETSDRVIFAKVGKNYKIISNSKNKFEDVSNYLKQEDLNWDNLVYIGDSEVDVKCVDEAFFSACPHDASPEVLEHAVYSAHAAGGRGAVYEIIRYFYKINKFAWNIDV